VPLTRNDGLHRKEETKADEDMPKNHIEQILEIKSRRRWRVFFGVPIRMMQLQSELKKADNFSKELLKYFPIAVVACIEVFFRVAIQQLIDAGPPCSDRIEKLNAPTLKVDAALVNAIAGKTVTLGELIAHAVPLNSLEGINRTMSVLLETDFLAQVRVVRSRFKVEIKNEPDEPMLKNADQVFADVKKTFELRHIFAHEGDIKLQTDAAEIKQCFNSSEAFLEASGEFISDVRYPDRPLTNLDRKMEAHSDLTKAQERVAVLTEAILKLLPEDRKVEFAAMDKAFESYSTAATELTTNILWGTEGTGRSPIWFSTLGDYVLEYVKSLESVQRWLSRDTD
jgi:hypothetical protein